MSADRSADDFGSMLRRARERRGVSVRQLASATKISVAALEALEQNDISRLPGGIFSRAFVRSYAVEVGLDPEKTIQQFVDAFPGDVGGARQPAFARPDDNEAIESERRTAVTFLRLIALSVPIAAAVLYFATVGHRAPAPAAAAAAPVAQPVPAPRVSPAPGEAVSSAAAAGPASTASVAPASAAEPVERLTVGLTVTRPCWVSAIVDGHKTIERLFEAGERRTVEVHRELVITAGDASAVALTLNGAEARQLGRTGEVITARLDLANFKEYLAVR
jgi:cytoskeleton protein RodZ